MAAREKIEEDNNRNLGISYDGVDDLFDHCNGQDGAPDMGSV